MYGTTNNITPTEHIKVIFYCCIVTLMKLQHSLAVMYSVFHQMSFLTKRTHVQMLLMMVERGVPSLQLQPNLAAGLHVFSNEYH